MLENNIHHLQIPGISVLLKARTSSYFEPYTKPHNSTSFTSKSSECARQGFPYVSETELDPFNRSPSKYNAKWPPPPIARKSVEHKVK